MEVKSFFEKASKLKVLIVGDVMIDRYLSGHVDRISPEAPVPVVVQVETEDRLGGAGNVALNIKAMGATAILCGLVGRDADGKQFHVLLEKEGLDTSGIYSSTERCTTVKTRIIADKQHLLRLDKENKQTLSQKESTALKEVIKHQLESQAINAIILQDYNKGVFSDDFIDWILLQSRRKGIPVAVDPKFKNFWQFKNVALFKPNLREVQDVLKHSIAVEHLSLLKAANSITDRLGNKKTLITLSEHGVFWAEGELSGILPTKPRKVADVCGAGDAVIGIAAIGLALELEMSEIALMANLVGGQVVERLGVVPVDVTQLKQELVDELFSD